LRTILDALRHASLTVASEGYSLPSKEDSAMARVQAKPLSNWCPQAKPDEQGQCGTDKLAEDGKRHHCEKPPGHTDDLHACHCGMEWRHMM